MSTNIALVKNATLHGVFWGSYMQHRPRVLRRSLEQLIAWLGEGRISIPIFHRRACLHSADISGQGRISFPSSTGAPCLHSADISGHGRISVPTFHRRACLHSADSSVHGRISVPIFHRRACLHSADSSGQLRDELQACAVRIAGRCWVPGSVSPQAQPRLLCRMR